MNLEEEQPTQIQPTQPSQFHLPTCPTHPNESFTGFCPACLCERLAGLEISASTSNSTRPKPNTSTASAALKAIFRTGDNKNNNKASSSNSVLPELRRCKSFSGGKGEGFSGVFEPQRRSCDVRGRSSLWCLFSQDDERKLVKKSEIEIESSDLGFSGGVTEPVKEEGEEEEELEQEVEQEEEQIRVSNVGEIIEEEEIVQVGPEEEEEEKRMKDHIEIDSQTKKPPSRDLKEIAGNFWTAASVFSKKLQKWRSKQKRKKSGRGGGSVGGVGDGASTTMQVEKPYSEIGDYGFGRRSCDIDPRFSLDAARMSFDDPRYSWDEPRASWDGYMIGRMFPRVPPMVSVVEHVGRVDDQIPVEEPIVNEGDEGGDTTPGGTAQTRDYYSDSSRRKSLDRSNSIRKKAAAVVAELDETVPVSNAKVTPATTEILYGSKLLGTDKNPRDLLSHSHSRSNSNSHSLRDDCSESFESVFRDNASIASGKGLKKSRRWSKAWNIWGLISKRGGNKDEEDERYSRGNVVQRSFSESWPELRREPNGEVKNGFNRMLRSNSSVSSRNSFSMSGSVSSMRRTAAETNGHGKKKKEECVLERNRSARYSPNDVDNGLLRFYLTPMRSSSRRNGAGMSRPKTSHSIASSVLRLY